MALKKDKKNSIVEEVSKALLDSKLTVVAEYKGTSVKAMQELRKQAKDNNAVVKVIKNRLVVKAISNQPAFKDADTSVLNGMLLYAFSNEDEVAGAQTIATFAKKQPTLKIVGGYTNAGEFINAQDANAIASLPSKDQLRAMLVGTIAAPLTGFVSVVSGNLRGVVNVLNARAEQLS
jgi:large subunit ribosomal protein L10